MFRFINIEQAERLMRRKFTYEVAVKWAMLQPIGLFNPKHFLKNDGYPRAASIAREYFCCEVIEKFQEEFGKSYAAWTRRSSFEFIKTMWFEIPFFMRGLSARKIIVELELVAEKKRRWSFCLPSKI